MPAIMQPGDFVEFIHPQEGENQFLMRIVWIDPPRAMIETFVTGLPIQPTRVVLVEEIQPKR